MLLIHLGSRGNCEQFIYCGYSERLGRFPGVTQLEIADKSPPIPTTRCALLHAFIHSFIPSCKDQHLLRADAEEMEVDLKSP